MGRPSALAPERPIRAVAWLPQEVEERDAVRVRVDVRGRCEAQTVERDRDALEVPADGVGQVAVHAQHPVDARARRGAVRDEAHVDREDAGARLTLVLRGSWPVADAVDEPGLGKVAASQAFEALEAR